jgi:hypothetical protein
MFKDLVSSGKLQFDNDDFFVNALIMTGYPEAEKVIYNKNIGRLWYKFYFILLLSAFYGPAFMFRKDVSEYSPVIYSNVFFFHKYWRKLKLKLNGIAETIGINTVFRKKTVGY